MEQNNGDGPNNHNKQANRKRHKRSKNNSYCRLTFTTSKYCTTSRLVLGLHDGFLLSADLLNTVLLLLALLARALVSGLVSGHLWESQRPYRTIAQNGEQAYAGKAVLGLELFSRSSIVIDQGEARALATTELVVETVDLPQNLRGNKTSCRAQ